MPSAYVSAAVEGDADEAAARKIVETLGATVVAVFGKRGKPHLDRQIRSYNNAARYAPWIVLRDLDHDAPCPSALVGATLPSPAPKMCYRIVVRAIEAWLMADPATLGPFLSVPLAAIPMTPDSLDNPKEAFINLARRSRSRNIIADIVPPPGGVRPVGPAYNARLIEYVLRHWRPADAAARSPSLARCLDRARIVCS